VALDNIPGALVYTDDDLKIVFCNERFKEMYPAPRELLQSGRPYPDFLRLPSEFRVTNLSTTTPAKHFVPRFFL
jgi:PAS domain-containing protein